MTQNKDWKQICLVCVVDASIFEWLSAVACNMDSVIAMEEDVNPEDLQVLSCWLCLLYVVQYCCVTQ